MTSARVDQSEGMVVGLHLSGASAAKSSLIAFANVNTGKGSVICKVYDKIGPVGTTFSDERLVEILSSMRPISEIFVDCPMSFPPCVTCQRDSCPGVVKCEDLSVAYMLAVTRRHRQLNKRKNKLPNPQSQRLWDVLYLSGQEAGSLEPTYNSNRIPLVTRAIALQKRLNNQKFDIKLRETSVPMVLHTISSILNLDAPIWNDYRRFDGGLACRKRILARFIELGWIDKRLEEGQFELVCESTENFQAMVAAWMATIRQQGLVKEVPSEFLPGEGWVYLPNIERIKYIYRI